MDANKLVSVVIPVFNSRETIIKCVESALNQSYFPIEIILVDDGSTDDTCEIIETYKEKNHIDNLFIYKQKNSGPSVARNFGISMSHGEYVAFLDSDDSWHPEKIKKQVRLMEREQVDLCGTLTKPKNPTDTREFQIVTFKKLILSNCYRTPSIVIRKKVLENNLFNENQRHSEDYRLWLQIAAKGYKCVLLLEHLVYLYGKPLYGYSGLSANLWAMEKGELSIFYYLLQEGHISYVKYIGISLFSFLKYIRRIFITLTYRK